MEAALAVESPARGVQERVVGFVAEVTARLPHRRQRENAGLYVRGLVEHGGRKSVQPTLFRLGEDGARYESVQQFLADSPWDPTLVVRACAERVAAEIAVLAWIVDDTSVKKDGKHSPGVKRQWSGTLGKIDNCQITVSVHAVGARGTVPLGWRLYLPQEWCDDLPRRRKAKIPDAVGFETKAQLAASLVEEALGWEIPTAPILADAGYGDDTAFRTRASEGGLEYVVAVSPNVRVFGPETRFAAPTRRARGGSPTVARPDRRSEPVAALAERLPAEAWRTLPYRTTPAGEEVESRFAFLRVVVAADAADRDHHPPRSEWLIIEWPQGADGPSDYWLSNLGEDEPRHRLARLARLRWTIELDYHRLKGELGLDHYEGRSYLGFHHHCALVTCAHAFLTLEQLGPQAPRPA